MSRNYLIIDGNSLGYFAQNGAILKLGNMEVQAIYNFLRNLRETLALYPSYIPIIAWDGASWRNMLYPDYKADRELVETTHQQKQMAGRQSYKLQRPRIQTALRLLGITQISATNMEADDLGGILADRYAPHGKVVLYTGDQDWLQLVGPNVIWKDFINKRTVTMANFEEFTGLKTTAEFLEYKALVGGDDNIKGVGGIGGKGAIEFIKTYGSFADFFSQVSIEKTVDHAKLPKKYRDLIDDESKAIRFALNIKLMDLRTPARPAPINLTVDKGTPDLGKFQRFCEILLFSRILDKLDTWIMPFKAFQAVAA